MLGVDYLCINSCLTFINALSMKVNTGVRYKSGVLSE